MTTPPASSILPCSDKPAPVAITGFGLVTSLGQSAWETFSELLAGKLITHRLAKLSPDLDAMDVVKAVGSVPTARHGGDPAVALAERATREALFMADHTRSTGTPPPCNDQTVWLMGSSKGAVHALVAAADTATPPTPRHNPSALKPQAPHRPFHSDRLAPAAPPDAALAVALGPHGYLSYQLSRRLGCGPIRQTVAACASSLIALHQAKGLLTQGPIHLRPRRVVVMTSEAALLELFIASYRRLGVIPPPQANPQGQFAYHCNPLNDDRSGFVLAEMGAAIVLEPLDQITVSSNTLVLAQTAHACDGYDLIRTNPNMAGLARVASQLLTPQPVGLIHAHATGTLEHDPAELAAYAQYLRHPADVYAVKGAIGHGLGAAGLASVVIACLCALAGRRPAMPWLTRPISLPSPNLLVQATPSSDTSLQRQAVFAAGFGGHVAGAVVERLR